MLHLGIVIYSTSLIYFCCCYHYWILELLYKATMVFQCCKIDALWWWDNELCECGW